MRIISNVNYYLQFIKENYFSEEEIKKLELEIRNLKEKNKELTQLLHDAVQNIRTSSHNYSDNKCQRFPLSLSKYFQLNGFNSIRKLYNII